MKMIVIGEKVRFQPIVHRIKKAILFEKSKIALKNP